MEIKYERKTGTFDSFGVFFTIRKVLADVTTKCGIYKKKRTVSDVIHIFAFKIKKNIGNGFAGVIKKDGFGEEGRREISEPTWYERECRVTTSVQVVCLISFAH